MNQFLASHAIGLAHTILTPLYLSPLPYHFAIQRRCLNTPDLADLQVYAELSPKPIAAASLGQVFA